MSERTQKKIIKKFVKRSSKKPVKIQTNDKEQSWMPVNRKKFMSWINTNFLRYQSTGVKRSTKRESGQPGLFLHQQLVQKFMSVNSPYRGLLLYHGLGSGKTCSSIAIAEGLKAHMKVDVLLPASLRPNYISELKFCGDERYYLQQHWTFERCSVNSKKARQFQDELHIPAKVFRKFKPQGCWISSRGRANFKTLDSDQQQQIHFQIEAVMESNYQFIHYNGIRKSHCDKWESMANNPFNDKLIIIDEVHNFISRVVGGGNTGYRLYKLLLSAVNARFVLLSGTPMINYPHEAGILLNLLRGQMTSYLITLTKNGKSGKWTETDMKKILESLPVIDYYRIDSYNQQILVSRLPIGFVKVKDSDEIIKGDGNSQNEREFLEGLKIMFGTLECRIGSIKTQKHLAYPDDKDGFEALFLKGDRLDNTTLLRDRMMGMISYYQGAKDDMFPSSYMMVPNKTTGRLNQITQRDAYDQGNFVIPVEMSDYQFKKYEEIRIEERKLDTSNRKKAVTGKGSDSFSSYYRVFSRCYGNFVFPEGLERPIPGNSKLNIEDAEDVDGFEEEESTKLSALKIRRREEYIAKKRKVMSDLDRNKLRYLSLDGVGDDRLAKFSPKYAEIIKHLATCPGNSFVYSQFREMEGIGIFSKALEANGYAPFVIHQNPISGDWEIMYSNPSDVDKPKFCFYTGWETNEVKEITKTIFNNELEKLPESLRAQILAINKEGNLRGEIIKVFLATSSAAEGITLCNVRQVHIMEPYWNPVRTEQVIGRAVRIGSHSSLPLKDRKVDIYSYVSSMTPTQLKESFTIRNKDQSMTSDEYLYDISEKKRAIMQGIIQLFKESSIDCTLNSADNEPVKCARIPHSVSEPFIFSPDIYTRSSVAKKTSKSPDKKIAKTARPVNQTKKINWIASKFSYKGKDYIINKTKLQAIGDTAIYDINSYNNYLSKGSDLIEVGKITFKPHKSIIFY